MRKSTRRIVQYFALPAFAGAVWMSLPNPHAQARPQYLKQFAESYPVLEEPTAQAKCAICHPKASKTERNPYGKAVLTALDEQENVKNPKTIAAALRAAEAESSSMEGKTFGDLIRDGKLPE